MPTNGTSANLARIAVLVRAAVPKMVSRSFALQVIVVVPPSDCCVVTYRALRGRVCPDRAGLRARHQVRQTVRVDPDKLAVIHVTVNYHLGLLVGGTARIEIEQVDVFLQDATGHAHTRRAIGVTVLLILAA